MNGGVTARNGGAPGPAVPVGEITKGTAIRVTDGAVEVVSEGHWKLFTR
jgi:hypothetical protein